VFALPSEQGRKHVFALKPNPTSAACRLIVNGEPCDRPSQRRGLCLRHYTSIWQRSDLDLDDYGLAPLPQRWGLRVTLFAGMCRVREEGTDGPEKAHARGLCARHYKILHTHPGRLDELAKARAPRVTYARRHRPLDGHCRVAENGVGCAQGADVRGLCQRHYDALHRRADHFDTIARPPTPVVRRRCEKALDAGDAPLVCLVLANGLRCCGAPAMRGVCRRHHRILGNHRDYSLADFYLPERASVLSRKFDEETADGLCGVMEDGAPCARTVHVRGLCRARYRVAEIRGQLEVLALPARSRPNVHGAGNDRPHDSVDKNVLYDHADHKVFGSSGQDASVSLVESIRARQARGSIRLDAVKSTYGHVRYRLNRPSDDGGRGASEEEAEARARGYVQETFYRGGAWRFLHLDPQAFGRVVAGQAGALTLEDALEFQTYQHARVGRGGPTMFATRDTDFPEGVHPTHVMRQQRGRSPRA